MESLIFLTYYLVEDISVEILGFKHNISLRYSYLYMHYVNIE